MTSTTIVKGLRWMMLGPSAKSQISPEAHLHTEPLKHLYNRDLNTGQPRLIDWATIPDWYDHSVHWRGWILVDALDTDIIPCPSESHIPFDPIIVGTLGKEFLTEEMIGGAFKLNNLRKELLDFFLDLKRLHIPIPAPALTLMFDKAYEDTDQLREDLCHLCYGMLDLIGFFRWASFVFSRELARCRVWHSIIDIYEWLDYSFVGKSIGYLVHLEAHQTEFSFQFCIQNEVPLYYPWYNKYREIPCLKQFDPFFLGLDSRHLVMAQARELNFFPFDQHLQGGVESGSCEDQWAISAIRSHCQFWRMGAEGAEEGGGDGARILLGGLPDGRGIRLLPILSCVETEWKLWLGGGGSNDDINCNDPPLHKPF